MEKRRNIQFARTLRTASTDAEARLWQGLRARQLNGCKFRRQVPMGDYVVDFVCLDARLIVEVDGGQHADRQDYDATRTAWLQARGFRVLRFWNNDVLLNPEGVLGQVLAALPSGHPHPTPLPPAGEGAEASASSTASTRRLNGRRQ